MAVTFDAVGPSSAGTAFTTGPGTWTHVNGGNGIFVGITIFTGSSNTVTGVTYGGVTVPFLGFINPSTTGGIALYGLVGPTCPTGSNTVSVTASDTNNHNCGSISVSGAGSLGTVFTNFVNTPSATGTVTVNGTTTGGLIVSAVSQGGSGTFSATSPNVLRWSHIGSANTSSDNGASGTDPSTGGGANQTVTWTDANSDFWGLVAVEVLPPGGGGGSGGVAQARQQRRGKRAGRRSQAQRQQIQPAFGTPPPAAGIAVLQGTGILGTAAVQGAGASLTGAGSVSASTAPACITGLGGTGAGYFADQHGNPRMVLGDAAWGLPGNAGRWNSGNWQADYDTYLATRAAQGFTVIYTKPIGTTQSGNLDDQGKTFDSLYPFQGGSPSTGVSAANPSSGLTSSFWARIDYMLASALAKGITVFFNAIGYDSDFSSGPGPLFGKSTTEFTAYGTALGTRYAGQQNLIWHLADDYFGENDALITAFLTGLTGAGDTHAVSIENFAESTSRQDISNATATAWGAAHAQYNFCYSYNVTYFGVEKAYLESSPVPVLQGDGYFYQGGATYAGGSGAFAHDRAVRQDAWHAISSGARGYILGDEAVWKWTSGAQAQASSAWFHSNNAGNIRALMESLPGWHTLVPDTSSVLVTAGRGTHATTFSSGGGGGQYEIAFTDSYVTASRGPDSGSGASVAVIYMSHGTTITIDQTKMVSGYTATWVDPISGATSSATAGTTYNSTAKGNNSQGDPDWALVLQAPVITTIPGSATLTGTGSLATAVTQGAGASLIATGALTAAVTQGAGASLIATGALTAAVTQGAPTALAGAGSLATAVTQGAGTALAGAGSLATAVTQGAGTALAAAGSLGNLDATGAPAVLAGAGFLGTAATLAAPATLTGAGFLGTTVTQGAGAAPVAAGFLGTTVTQGAGAALTAAGSLTGSGSVAGASGAALTGTGTLSPASVLAAPAILAGSGSLAAAAAQLSPAVLAGTGFLSALAIQGAGVSLAAAGSIAAAVTQGAAGILAGAGSLTAAAGQGAILAGTGSLAAPSVLIAPAVLTAAGSLTAAAAQGAPATLTGTGSLAAAVTQLAGTALDGTGTIGASGSVASGTGAALTGTGFLSTAGTQGAGTAVAAAGSLGTAVTQGAGTAVAGTGFLAGSGGPAGAASLAGTGFLAGSGAVAGGTSAGLTGTGFLGTAATQRAAMALAGTGFLAAAAAQQAGTALIAAGSLLALGTQHPPQVKGFSIDYAVTEPMQSSGTTVTEPMQSSGTAVTQPAGSAASVS